MTNDEISGYLDQASEIALSGMLKGEGGPFGSIIVKDKQIIGRGNNKVLSNHDATAHAEIVAIREASAYLKTHDLSGSILFTNCEPCPMCLSAIYWANIEKIYYVNSRKDAAEIGFRDDFLYTELVIPPLERKIPGYFVENEKARESFKEWMNKKDREIY